MISRIIFSLTFFLSVTCWAKYSSAANLKLTIYNSTQSARDSILVSETIDSIYKILYSRQATFDDVEPSVSRLLIIVKGKNGRLTGTMKKRAVAIAAKAEELASLASIHGKYKETEMIAHELLAFYKVLSYPRTQYTYELLEDVSVWKGNLEKKLLYSLEAFNAMKASNDTAHADRFYYGVGCSYAQLKFYDKAAPYLLTALSIAKAHSDNEAYHFIFEALGSTLQVAWGSKRTLAFLLKEMPLLPAITLSQKKNDEKVLAEAFKGIKAFDKSEIHYLRMIRLNEQMNIQKNAPFIYNIDILLLIKFYIKTSRYNKAKFYLSKILRTVNSLDARGYSELAFCKFKIDSASGIYLSALRNFQIYKRIDDSLFNSSKSKELAEIQLKYETAQKDKKFKLQAKDIQLLIKQSLIQQKEVASFRVRIGITIGSLLIAIGVVVYRYRLKASSNRQLTAKQQEIILKNTALENLLKDNDLLLTEVHHRVKNNLHTVLGLLKTQSSYLKDEAALAAVMESRHRIHAMSLIHQKTYNSEHVRGVNMLAYVGELIDYLKDSLSPGMEIHFKLDIEALNFDLATAIPVGLILNEAITNALKYAFFGLNKGLIAIKMASADQDMVLLNISDNGIGLPEHFDINKNRTFGMTLIQGLVEDLGGKFSIGSHHGTIINITFSLNGTNKEDFAHLI